MEEKSDAARGAGSPLSGPEEKRSEEAEGLPGGRSERREAARKEARASAGRRRYTHAQREEMLAALESSGEDLTAFCRSRGIAPTTVRTWQDRIVKLGEPSPPRRRRASYTAEERRAAVEAYQRSGRGCKDFAKLWGVSPWTLTVWLRRYQAEGARGLEARYRGGPGRPRTIPAEVRERIAHTKRRFPTFGLRKVRDWLLRFEGIGVSTGTVRSTLEERGIEGAPPARRVRRVRKALRRFERARPMQLWQSDITSYVLARHSVRVYLVVFLDDRSRYVVSWSLCTHAKTEMVQECLLDGIARFGKPEEVLSDQGPQYYSWRGKSAFQKLLVREGIRHVVARTHHPQTLGKCERLWKTVGEELWERARPQELSEARERLGHYFAHYNHFRPHQGIEGLVPADRFFGAEDAARRTIEEQLSKNELARALSREPRRTVYLFGQIGDRQVSLVGEHGRVVVHTEGGAVAELASGTRTDGQSSKEEKSDERDDHGRTRAEHDGGQLAAAASHAHGAQAHALRDPGAPGAVGAGAVAGGEPGGAEPGAPAVDGDPGVLAGQDAQGGDRAAAGGAGAARLAALADGALGHAGGALAPAQESPAGPSAGAAGEPGGGSQAPAPAHPRAGAQAGADGGPGAGAEGPALGSKGSAGGGAGGERWQASTSETGTQGAPWGAGIPRT